MDAVMNKTETVRLNSAPDQSALVRPTVRSLLSLGTGHLRVSLFDGVSVLIPMVYVQEVMALPAHRLSALPNLPSPVLGLMNRRSQVLWLVIWRIYWALGGWIWPRKLTMWWC